MTGGMKMKSFKWSGQEKSHSGRAAGAKAVQVDLQR